MIYYVVFYFVAQLEKKQLQWLMALNVLAYFMLYFSTRDLNKWCVEAPDYFKYVFYFGVMLAGYYSRVSKIIQKEIPWGMISIASLIGYFVSKIVVNYDNRMMRFQFLVQMATLSFAMSTVVWAINKEAFFETFCEGHRRIGTIIRHIGASTLEIYLLNYVVVSYSSAVSFPVNIGIAFICIFFARSAFTWHNRKNGNICKEDVEVNKADDNIKTSNNPVHANVFDLDRK